MFSLLSVLLVVCLAISGLVSATETALFSLSSTKVRVYKSHSNPHYRQIANILAHPRDLIVTILIINIVANIMVQNIVSNLVDDSAGWAITVGVPLVLTLLCGEILPKAIGLANNEAWSLRVSAVVLGIRNAIGPIRIFLIRITSFVNRILLSFLRPAEGISKDELMHVLESGEQTGVLQPDEALFISGYLHLQGQSVKELMQPRGVVIYFDLQRPLSELCDLFLKKHVTRLPLCRGDLQNVVGVLSSQVYLANRDKIKTAEDVLKLGDKPYYVPESMPARTLLRNLARRQKTLALVVDEYGAVSGCIAREDAFETIVGEIADSREHEQKYVRGAGGVVIGSGQMELKDFEQLYHVNLPNPNNLVTVGGWLTEIMQEIPKSGLTVQTHGFLFHVLSAEANCITRLYIRPLPKTEEASS